MSANEVARAREVAKAAMEGKPLPITGLARPVDESLLTAPHFVIGYLASSLNVMAAELERAEARLAEQPGRSAL